MKQKIKITVQNRLFVLLSLISFLGCQKGWLTEKRSLNTVVPTSLEDMRAILNGVTSPDMAANYTSLGFNAGEEMVLSDGEFNAAVEIDRNAYLWKTSLYPDPNEMVIDWNDPYRQILAANVVLEGMANITLQERSAAEWRDVKGGALFYRAKAFFELAQLFAPPYVPGAANDSPYGIPLRVSSDPNKTTTRASVGQTYERIVGDLKEASALLTTVTPTLQRDASKVAALALLARCYLSMADYGQAFLYADSALWLHPRLLDYNTLLSNTGAAYPIPAMNDETIFYGHFFVTSFFGATVDPDLIELYDPKDLRLLLFFNETGNFRGNYTGSFRRFSGLSSDEMYLIRAECQARAGNTQLALDDLNELLRHRFPPEDFILKTTDNTPDLLAEILRERRKQLVFRGHRWTDLRRLNQEPGRETVLQRTVMGQTHELLPLSTKYTFPLPEYIITMTDIAQNP